MDPAVAAEIRALSRRGLLICAGVEFGMTLVTLLLRNTITYGPGADPLAWWGNAPFLLLGTLALVAWKLDREGRFARAFCVFIAFSSAATLSTLDTFAFQGEYTIYAGLDIMLVLLVTLAIVPLSFWQSLPFSLGVTLWHAGANEWSMQIGLAKERDPVLVPIAIAATLCAVLSGLNYKRMVAGVLDRRAMLDAELRRAQSEYAATVAKLAAAVSHELNTPLGVIRSASDSIAIAAARHTEAPSAKLAALQSDLAATIRDSAARIGDIVTRMQRFTNLDRSDVQPADLGQVLEDVARLSTVNVDIDLPSVPLVLLQPAVVGGVLATLLHRAADRGETVRIAVRPAGSNVDLRLELGAATSLDPEFAVHEGRVGTANWDVFHARQMLRAAGAGVRMEGTAMVVSFPAAGPADRIAANPL